MLLKRFIIRVLSLLLLLGNITFTTTFAQSIKPTEVFVNVPTFLEIGTVPDIITDSYTKVTTFPVFTNVPAILSAPPIGVLTRLGGTETLTAKYFLDPSTIAPPGNESVGLKITVVPNSGVFAGTYKGEATITLTAQL